MFHVVLFEPQIPPNAGNIMRLCSNSGAQLHLIHPLGFQLDDKRLRRAGLDYTDWANIREYTSYHEFLEQNPERRIFAFSTRGQRFYSDADFQANDALLFGPETRGLPADVLNALPAGQILRVPMRQGSRSLNLSNTVAIVLYAAWARYDFVDGV
jgi:tRNA (cytidine/uridine-2'-O-)-methyltransferase